MAEVKVSANDVRLFFKNADLDLADLVLEIAGETIKGRKSLSKKISDNMAKARGARKGPKAAAGNQGGQGQAAAETETPASQVSQTTSENPIASARARRAAAGSIPSVPAPAHTAEATSAEADATI